MVGMCLEIGKSFFFCNNLGKVFDCSKCITFKLYRYMRNFLYLTLFKGF